MNTSPKRRQHWPFLILLSSLLLWNSGCGDAPTDAPAGSPLPYYSEATFTPHWLEEALVPEGFHRVPSFSLKNQLGETITEAVMDNKISVVNFFFTSCPGICPKMNGNLAAVQEAFRDDDGVILLSHSVMPAHDSVPVLLAYAEENGVNSQRWQLLTGDRKDIYDLGRNHYFVEEDLGQARDPDDFIHTENLVLVDQNRHLRGIYNGLNPAAIEQLIADIQSLQE